MRDFLDKFLGTFLIFVLPLLVMAFAPYLFVAIFAVIWGALWYFATMNPDPDLAWEEYDGRIDPCLILLLAAIVILLLRFVSA